METNTKISAYILRGSTAALLFSCVIVAICSAINLPEQPPKVLPPQDNAAFGANADQSRTLSFADRVAYQRAIEEVYWRHRIWPDTNAGPKPPLDAVMSQAQLEKKVEEYLRNSQTLEDYWQRPLTADQLQAEMERMASHTKQPEVLRELFEALGNDPFVIAECLARPVLTERLIADVSDQDQTGRLDSLRTAELRTVSIATMSGQVAYTLPGIATPYGGCTDDTWPTPTTLINVPTAARDRTTVWTGSEMIVWGGSSPSTNTGGRYNPSTDSWTPTSTTKAPTARSLHTAVWTGSEMIVWGGQGGSITGGRYSPSTNSWTATSTTNAPTGRSSHTAVWTGSEMIVWGGSPSTNTGGRYNPSTDSWTPTSTSGVPAARYWHAAVWTGSEMIVWGGLDAAAFNTGGRYNPITDSWTATTTNAPAPRSFPYNSQSAVWTGSEMIVWGGFDAGVFNTGGRYNPSSDSWTSTSLTNAPAGRYEHTAVWTGSEMIVWGGFNNVTAFNTGGRYNPSTNSWTATSTTNAPTARRIHMAVWTGSEMIVWGGFAPLNTGGRYCAQPSTPLVQRAVSRKGHGNAGTFDLDLPVSGTPGIECRGGGATNDYTLLVTFLANVSVNGNPQAAVSSGIGTIGSGGVSNGGMVTTSGNVLTIPLTNVANAQTINVTLNDVNGSTNLTIPMGLLIADVDGDGFVNSGDAQQTRNRSGQTTDASNFRSDVDADGFINSGDTTAVRSRSGTFLP